MGNRFKPAAIAALTGLTLAGCNLESAGSGSLSLDITDAPVDDAEAVVVTFNGVVLHAASGSTTEINYDAPRQIDLLALQAGDTQALLEDETLAAGDYQWIRLMVSAEADGTLASYIDVGSENDPDRRELTIPSGDQSGLKLVQGFTVPVNGSARFTIDFDLRKSVVATGQGYKLRPALRLLDNAEVGKIAGAATQDCVVYVFAGHDATLGDVGSDNEPVTTAFVDEENEGGIVTYEYTAAFLSAGDYSVAETCNAGNDTPDAGGDDLAFSTAQNVTVQAGQTAVANF